MNSTGVFIFNVRPHYSAPSSATLAESSPRSTLMHSSYHLVIIYCASSVGLLRPFVFYNRLAIGQKDRLTVTYLCSASTAPTDKAARRPTVLDCTTAHDQHLYDGFTTVDGRWSMREAICEAICRSAREWVELIDSVTWVGWLDHGS